MKKNNKGFTLAELLVVVAIIAVLVAISIPLFTSQLEKAKEATDLANIRAAYAQACTDALTGNGTATVTTVPMTQKDTNWEYQKDSSIGEYSTAPSAAKPLPAVAKGNTLTITVSNDVVTIAATPVTP